MADEDLRPGATLALPALAQVEDLVAADVHETGVRVKGHHLWRGQERH